MVNLYLMSLQVDIFDIVGAFPKISVFVSAFLVKRLSFHSIFLQFSNFNIFNILEFIIRG